MNPFIRRIAAAAAASALLFTFAAAATVAWGDRSEMVTRIQTRLREWGYYQGNVDGAFGQKTYDAVVHFQRTNGLPADGVVGAQTAAALGISLGSPVAAAAYQESETMLLARLINGEARGEPYIGQVAVGAVVQPCAQRRLPRHHCGRDLPAGRV